MDGEALGLCVVGLGGGRMVESDVIDPSVGLSDVVPLGARVTRGQPLLRIHAAREDAAQRAENEVRAAIAISASCPKVPPLIHERIT
jgi:thymidine phosphorylase